MTLELALAVVALVLAVALGVVLIRHVITVRRFSQHLDSLREDRDLLVTRVDELSQQVADTAALTPTGPEIALIFNPIKNNADAIRRQVVAAVRDYGFGETLVLETAADDPGTQMARDARAAGVRRVIAAGGDGTVRTVAEELAGSAVELGIIPLGTGNLLARNLGLPYADLDACIRIALQGAPRTIDTLDVRLTHDDGTRVRHAALVIGGAGLDADVMNDTRDDLKAKAGWIAYGEAGIRHLPGQRQDITVSMDGGSPRRYKIRSVLVANCGLLQGGMELLPKARLDDGLLDVMVLSPRHVFDWARIAAKTITKHGMKIPIMETHQAQRVQIRFSEPMASQLDGDATGLVTRIDARVVPDSLHVMAPSDPA
ncbi:MAG: diacylglycerol kinase family lipid kinase [Micrococcus sp.]|nr:diacylglycerol kinase family lipid kinase [Micrococcus sp.]